MKEYRKDRSLLFPLLFLGVVGMMALIGHGAGEVGTGELVFLIVSGLVIALGMEIMARGTTADFILSESELKFRTGFKKEWQAVAFSEVRTCTYSKAFRRHFLHINTDKPYVEYSFLLNGLSDLEDFRQSLKKRLGERYSEKNTMLQKVSNYLPS